MYTNRILAVTGVLIAAVAAVPMADFQHHHQHHPNKRAIVWVTKYEDVWETVAVTKTVWVTPGETKPTAYPTKEQVQVKPAAVTPAASPVPVAPAYVAPAPVESEPAAASVAPASSYAAPSYVAPTPEANVAPAPASTYVAPAPYVAPVASSAAAPAPASSAEAPSYGGGSSGGGQTYSGDLTYYDVGLGACGVDSTANEPVVAISHVLFDAVSTGNPNTNPLCGKYVSITGSDGNVYQGKIVDRCPSCEQGSLDLSTSFFKTVVPNGDGRVHGMKWTMGS